MFFRRQKWWVRAYDRADGGVGASAGRGGQGSAITGADDASATAEFAPGSYEPAGRSGGLRHIPQRLHVPCAAAVHQSAAFVAYKTLTLYVPVTCIVHYGIVYNLSPSYTVKI